MDDDAEAPPLGAMTDVRGEAPPAPGGPDATPSAPGPSPAVPDQRDRSGTAGDRGTGGGYVVEPRPSPAHRAARVIDAARRRASLVLAVGLALIAALATLAIGVRVSAGTAPAATPAPAAPGVPSAPAADPGPPASATPQSDLRATDVALPTLGVRSTLVGLDIGPNGALQAPTDPAVAGWYVRGAAPGEPGPTVIAGHVDSHAGPAVFYRLDELKPGDRVEVTRSDGQVFAYRVATVEQHPKNDFPTARVYGPTPGPELRLITCGGDFDHRSRHYRDNIIVTAIPIG